MGGRIARQIAGMHSEDRSVEPHPAGHSHSIQGRNFAAPDAFGHAEGTSGSVHARTGGRDRRFNGHFIVNEQKCFLTADVDDQSRVAAGAPRQHHLMHFHRGNVGAWGHLRFAAGAALLGEEKSPKTGGGRLLGDGRGAPQGSRDTGTAQLTGGGAGTGETGQPEGQQEAEGTAAEEMFHVKSGRIQTRAAFREVSKFLQAKLLSFRLKIEKLSRNYITRLSITGREIFRNFEL